MNSYDAYQTNERFKQSGATNSEYNAHDIVSEYSSHPKKNRGDLLDYKSYILEPGLKGCDYIAMETNALTWQKKLAGWYRPIELHIPCRDPK